MPFFVTFWNSESTVFFTMPLRVTKSTAWRLVKISLPSLTT